MGFKNKLCNNIRDVKVIITSPYVYRDLKLYWPSLPDEYRNLAFLVKRHGYNCCVIHLHMYVCMYVCMFVCVYPVFTIYPYGSLAIYFLQVIFNPAFILALSAFYISVYLL